MKQVLSILMATTFIAIPAFATPIVGEAKVIDGDTLYVGNIKVRLEGIDAPEQSKPGGFFATSTLSSIVGITNVHCELTGDVTYDRMVGVCYTLDGRDLAAEVIRAGAALDCMRFSKGRYRSLEPSGIRAKLPQAKYCY
ncbi:thermonuclease family protein [Falsihalocynthiibacter sp. BN13B15]|uniref:thermonuclease family protein n=1 Tax=Falsihalocynthiibacter sp. BN13B15 TaxID=3240871 RepID=UPI00350FAFF3